MDMNQIKYDGRSPYSQTIQTTKYIQYLDFWNPINISPSSEDKIFNLDPKYSNRPDLLSYDLYGSPQYWWVFAVRNPDVIKDPIYDFIPGITIYVPSSNSVGIYTK